MNEFMLLIKATGDPIRNLVQEKQEEHLQKVGGFIQGLVAQGKLKDAQPFVPGGIIISNVTGNFVEQSINENEEMIAGYYLIKAKDFDEAKEIVKSDPRFEDGKWSMEIRQIMKMDGINK